GTHGRLLGERSSGRREVRYPLYNASPIPKPEITPRLRRFPTPCAARSINRRRNFLAPLSISRRPFSQPVSPLRRHPCRCCSSLFAQFVSITAFGVRKCTRVFSPWWERPLPCVARTLFRVPPRSRIMLVSPRSERRTKDKGPSQMISWLLDVGSPVF